MHNFVEIACIIDYGNVVLPSDVLKIINKKVLIENLKIVSSDIGNTSSKESFDHKSIQLGLLYPAYRLCEQRGYDNYARLLTAMVNGKFLYVNNVRKTISDSVISTYWNKEDICDIFNRYILDLNSDHGNIQYKKMFYRYLDIKQFVSTKLEKKVLYRLNTIFYNDLTRNSTLFHTLSYCCTTNY